ncbi:hypothetical protein ACFQ6V_24920, partial [Streptomyces roseifaciens]
PFPDAAEAVRALYGAVKRMDLTKEEEKALRDWYTMDNYRSIQVDLHRGRVYERDFDVMGDKVRFKITPTTRTRP